MSEELKEALDLLWEVYEFPCSSEIHFKIKKFLIRQEIIEDD
jgi:hypothetical protein